VQARGTLPCGFRIEIGKPMTMQNRKEGRGVDPPPLTLGWPWNNDRYFVALAAICGAMILPPFMDTALSEAGADRDNVGYPLTP